MFKLLYTWVLYSALMARLLLLALAFAPPAAAGQDPQQEDAERLKKVRLAQADGHADVGDHLRAAQMCQWARQEYGCAVGFAPAHERSNRGLGRTVWNEDEQRWEIDPALKPPETRNLKKGDEAAKLWVEYQKRLDQLGRKAGKMYFELGEWRHARFEDDREKAFAAFRLALLCDPAHAGARARLGFVKQPDGPWLTPGDAALRKEMKEGIAAAPKGAPDATETAVESKLELKMRKQAGEHILVEAPHLDAAALEGLVQHGEHAYAMFRKLLNQGDLLAGSLSPKLLQSPVLLELVNQGSLLGRRMPLTILQTRAQHDKYVDVLAVPAAQKKFCRELGWTAFEICQGDLKTESLKDWIVHRTVMACCFLLLSGERLWLHEGLAYHFTRTMNGTALSHCTQFATSTVAKREKETWPEPAKWPAAIGEWLRTGREPDLRAVFRCTDAAQLGVAGSLKAWSVCEFLLAEHREKLVDFAQKSAGAGPEEEEKILQEVFGWSLEDLDRHWRTYARALYLEAK